MYDYAHARHAGNFADVMKLATAIALIEERLSSSAPITWVETHAGDGLYELGSAGEWTSGIEKLWSAERPAQADALTRRLAELVRAESPVGSARPTRHPGSPRIAQRLLRPGDRLILHEIDPAALEALRRTMESDRRAEIRAADGMAGLGASISGQAIALVDPSYANREEWNHVAETVAKALRSTPGATIAIWYPIKALTRPRAMLAQLAALGAHGTTLELIVTPLRLKRERLSGSGMALFNAAPATVSTVAASLVTLGPLLMTHGEWSAQLVGF